MIEDNHISQVTHKKQNEINNKDQRLVIGPQRMKGDFMCSILDSQR